MSQRLVSPKPRLRNKNTITRKKKPATRALTAAIAPKKERIASFILNVRSRHPSHKPLKRTGIRFPFRTVVRLGSDWTDDHQRIEINSVEAVKTSANKLLMKLAFQYYDVKTAHWFTHNQDGLFNEVGNDLKNGTISAAGLRYPIVAKHIYGSRGTGNYLIKTQEELTAWMRGKTLTNYIFEKFYDYNREYRLHVTKNGCFYTCRKMLKADTPEENRWYRNDSNSVWILENNPQFDKPVNWNAIVAESVKALQAVGLDIGALDVRVQSAENANGQVRTDPKFIILETNSAPSFGGITTNKYMTVVPQLILEKKYGLYQG